MEATQQPRPEKLRIPHPLLRTERPLPPLSSMQVLMMPFNQTLQPRTGKPLNLSGSNRGGSCAGAPRSGVPPEGHPCKLLLPVQEEAARKAPKLGSYKMNPSSSPTDLLLHRLSWPATNDTLSPKESVQNERREIRAAPPDRRSRNRRPASKYSGQAELYMHLVEALVLPIIAVACPAPWSPNYVSPTIRGSFVTAGFPLRQPPPLGAPEGDARQGGGLEALGQILADCTLTATTAQYQKILTFGSYDKYAKPDLLELLLCITLIGCCPLTSNHLRLFITRQLGDSAAGHSSASLLFRVLHKIFAPLFLYCFVSLWLCLPNDVSLPLLVATAAASASLLSLPALSPDTLSAFICCFLFPCYAFVFPLSIGPLVSSQLLFCLLVALLCRGSHGSISMKRLLYVHLRLRLCQRTSAILGVDFLTFPRKFCKSVNSGVTLMDLGVGGIIFTSGMVSRHAKVGEAICILSGHPYKAVYQFLVSALDLDEWMMEGPRTSKFLYLDRQPHFFSANREGIMGSLGFLCLFLMAVAVGHFMVTRAPIRSSEDSSKAENESRKLRPLSLVIHLFFASFLVLSFGLLLQEGLSLLPRRRFVNLTWVAFVGGIELFAVGISTACDALAGHQQQSVDYISVSKSVRGPSKLVSSYLASAGNPCVVDYDCLHVYSILAGILGQPGCSALGPRTSHRLATLGSGDRVEKNESTFEIDDQAFVEVLSALWTD
ncbi:hypothetical protein cyc_03664 [Cyclospora cayetanensis]|uniref:Transmembrane protein n=1 Tax=Cyclospora cayetanensis TaxID=88456 RepID=A0A1D3D9V9_9EIME|nr:hypothetical protein cyc_03664 [Cyclospora cayetanensis]